MALAQKPISRDTRNLVPKFRPQDMAQRRFEYITCDGRFESKINCAAENGCHYECDSDLMDHPVVPSNLIMLGCNYKSDANDKYEEQEHPNRHNGSIHGPSTI